MERNIDRWSSVGGTPHRQQYEHLLEILRELDEPIIRQGLTWKAGLHEFSLTVADLTQLTA
jgi:hypothetical protein